MVAPSGPMYQAGTLSGNPLAMSAGIAALKLICEQKSGVNWKPERENWKGVYILRIR